MNNSGAGSRMGKLTTHVLDTASGQPAAAVVVRVYRVAAERQLLATMQTGKDGRTGQPLLEGHSFTGGEYELEFDIGDYFAAHQTALADPPFLGTVVIRVSLLSGEHYHVPLLASPWSYSTYRGS